MRTNRTQQQWKHLIQQQAESNLNIEQFCRQQKISTSSFYKYRQLISVGTSFTKISVQSETFHHKITSSEHIKLVMPIGELQLPNETQPDYLVQLIKALSA